MKKKAVGIGAIGIGILLIIQNLGFVKGDTENFIMAGVFILLYLLTGYKKERGFVVFLAIGSVAFFQNAWDVIGRYFDFNRLENAFELWVLAFSFLVVHLIHYQGLRKNKGSWAKTVAMIVAVVGLFVLSFDYLQFAFSKKVMANIFPIALIVIGGFLRKQ